MYLTEAKLYKCDLFFFPFYLSLFVVFSCLYLLVLLGLSGWISFSESTAEAGGEENNC